MRKTIEIEQKNCQKIERSVLLIMITKDIINMIRVSKLLLEKIPNNEVIMDYKEEIGKSNMIIYTTEDGLSKIETIFDGDTVWLSKAQMAELFQRDRSVISKHIKNIFEEGELSREGNVQILHIANSDKPVEFYNLDVIISVGYRVKSKRGTQFRIWATGILKEYMRKGFALDDERLKNLGGGGYFKELLERIRDIRASEKVFYRQILEIYATVLTMIRKLKYPFSFFRRFRIKFIMPFMGRRRRKLFIQGRMRKRNLWGLPRSQETSRRCGRLSLPRTI